MITVRIINGSSGGGLVIRDHSGEESMIAIFAADGIVDFVMLGETECVVVARKGELALVDLKERTIKCRGKVSLQPYRIAIAPDGKRGIAAFNNGSMRVFSLPDLVETAQHSVSDGRTTPGPVFSSNGRVVFPVSHHGEKSALSKNSRIYDTMVGVAFVDIDSGRIEHKEIRRSIDASYSSPFPVRAISPDGKRAVLQSYDLISVAKFPFGKKHYFGLEIWDIEREIPTKITTFPYQPFGFDALATIDNQRFNKDEVAEANKEIEVLMPGVFSAYLGTQDKWLQSQYFKRENEYFEPREAQRSRAAFERVHYPPLIERAVLDLLAVSKLPFSGAPWEKLTERHQSYLCSVLSGWSKHAEHPIQNLIWCGPDNLIALGRKGIVREISLTKGPGPAYQLVDADNKPCSIRFDVSFFRRGERTFVVDLVQSHYEFELPVCKDFGSQNLDRTSTLKYRVIYESEQRESEKKKIDRLAKAMRPGNVKIKSRSAQDIVFALKALTSEVRAHLDEMVVDRRWEPVLQYDGKEISEQEFCDVLIKDGSIDSRDSLDALLTAFLDKQEGCSENIWYSDSITPTMSYVAFALIVVSETIPSSVMRFFARRDADHDMWTVENFEKLEFPPSRVLQPDMLALQMLLNIQDLCTGSYAPDAFALYNMPAVRTALHKDQSLVPLLADIIVGHIKPQAPMIGINPGGILKIVIEGLGSSNTAESQLAEELKRRGTELTAV